MNFPNFFGPSYVSQSAAFDCERVVGWYLERGESKGVRGPAAYYPTPGCVDFASATNGGVRGILGNQGRVYAVIGNSFQELTNTGTLTSRGALAINAYPATLVSDGASQLFTTSGNKGYITNTTTNIVTEVLSGVRMGGMLDLFFLGLDPDTGTLKISANADGTSWPESVQRSQAPDPWIALLVENGKIYLFGAESGEVWYNKGTSPVPFAPFSGSVIPYGIAAPFSLLAVNGAVTWLSQTAKGSYQVVRASGYSSADRISDYGVEAAIARYSRVDDAEAFVYQWFGHEFYVLSFPSVPATWIYDEAGGWHENGTWNSPLNRWDAWRPRCHVFAFNKHLVGDRSTGTIATLSESSGFDLGGGVIRRMRIAPPLGRDKRGKGAPKPVRVSRFSIELESGVALSSGQGSDPQIMFAKSKNGGKTFGNLRSRSAGALGVYDRVPFWGRVGSAMDFVPKIVVSDPIPWRLVGADIQLGGL